MRYNMVKKKHYYGEHYGIVRTGFIIGLDKSLETSFIKLVPYSLAVEPPPLSLFRGLGGHASQENVSLGFLRSFLVQFRGKITCQLTVSGTCALLYQKISG